jgi:Tol biopolymer transport system component
MDLWKLSIRDGKPAGRPELLRSGVGRILPLGITASGDYYFGLRSGQTDVFVTGFEHPAENARRATIRFPGRNTQPAWSPDGRLLAYLSRRGSENFGQESRAIVIRDVNSDQERELLPKLAHLERLRWSPDSRSLLVSGSDGKGRGGLFSVDAVSAAAAVLVADTEAGFRGYEGVWTARGKSIVYLRGDSEVRVYSVEARRESTLFRGAGLRHLAAAPDGKTVAVASDDAVIVVPLTGADIQTIAFRGATELEWGARLVAARGSELWSLSASGESPRMLDTPGNRKPGFSLHPDGKRIALTAGNAQSEIRMMRISGE